jgi:hypothetical protein
MPNATMEVQIEAGEASDDGADRVTFLLAPNPGESPRPLARAASGGELSRAMLAARVVLTDAPPTLVFDEVDAGIGGEAGTAVGRLLATLGARHQVLCVTHLAQVAAFAGTQVVVEKAVVQKPTSRKPGSERTVRRPPSSTATPGSRSCRGCSPGSATPRTPAVTPPSCWRRPRSSTQARTERNGRGPGLPGRR